MKKTLLGVAALTAAAVAVVRTSQVLGSTVAERTMPLPGDDHVASADIQATHGITIEAPADLVWARLIQIGQDRSGFYSYTALENMAGCRMSEVHDLRREWSTREVGESVALAPDVSLTVLAVDTGRALVLSEGAFPSEQARPWGLPSVFTWAFVLEPNGSLTRLITRERYSFTTVFERAFGNVVTVASCIMTEKMLRTIRELAEQDRMAERAPLRS